MSVIEVLAKTVQTMTTIEENTDYLLKNIKNIIDKHNEYSKGAKNVQEAYAVSHACFETLVENILEYVKAEKTNIHKYKKSCRTDVMAILEANE